jgi:hypothetical protein
MTDATPATEAQGLTEEQAVSEMLSRWGAKAETPPEKPEKPAPEEPAEETEPEQPKGDAQAEEEPAEEPEAPEDGDVEIDVAGEKFKFPKATEEVIRRVEAKAKEVEAGATRKFQEAADLRKAAEVQVQSAKQLQRISEAQADLIADHRMVARRLQTLESIDINSIEPDALSRLNAEYNQLQAARQRIEGQYGQNVKAMQDEDSKAVAAKREHSEKVLATKIKGWSPDHARKLSEYALGKGAPANALSTITDAWMVEILDDAAYGHAMRAQKSVATKRVEAAPTKTLKPGASGNPNSAAQARVNAAQAKVKKTGNLNDAAQLLLARMQARGRRP